VLISAVRTKVENNIRQFEVERLTLVILFSSSFFFLVLLLLLFAIAIDSNRKRSVERHCKIRPIDPLLSKFSIHGMI